MYKIFTFLLVAASLVSCSDELVDTDSKTTSVFGEVIKLSEIKNTDFLTTIESNFEFEKNQIYSPTILFCWQEIKNKYSESISDITGENLERLHESVTYQGVLDGGYKSSINVKPDGITAKASFNKSLEFEEPFDISKYLIIFNENEIQSFEFEGWNEQAQIGYYNSDDDFAIILQPKDYNHEIILMKSDFSNFNSSIFVYEKFIENYIQTSKSESLMEQAIYRGDDLTKIPVIKFNIEHSFEEFKGEGVKLQNIQYYVDSVYQRNAFILNQDGAKVESEAVVEVTKEVAMLEEELSTPKRLIFDNDFVVFLRMKDVQGAANYKGFTYPYFMVYITDNELLVPYNSK